MRLRLAAARWNAADAGIRVPDLRAQTKTCDETEFSRKRILRLSGGSFRRCNVFFLEILIFEEAKDDVGGEPTHRQALR